MIDETLRLAFGGASSDALILAMFIATLAAAATQCTAIGVSGLGPFCWRALTAVGWMMLSLRFVYAYWSGAMPTLPPFASLSVLLIAGGAILRNIADSSCRHVDHCHERP